MANFENSWEAIDKTRNPDMYETVKTEDGKEIVFLKENSGAQQGSGSSSPGQRFTKQEEENIAKAAEKMNDRED